MPSGSWHPGGHDDDPWPGLLPGPSLERSREIEKALRPLRLRLPSRTVRLLDEEATAESRAEQGAWVPRHVPAEERWLTVTLVVDDGESMALWTRTATRLAAVLAGSGAFRDVRVRHWRSAAGGPVAAGADGRHVVLVLTDMYAPHWRDGATYRRLARWAEAVPVAVVSVLPEYLWSRLPVVPAPTRLRSPGPAAPNRSWTHRPDGLVPPGAVPRARVAAGARAGADPSGPGGVGAAAAPRAAGGVHHAHRCGVRGPPAAPAVRRPAPPPPLSAADRVRRLRAQLSPVAYHLARLGPRSP
ncbi:hypothetical protein DN402_00795 [Streptomyces sp. SW4]|nr:hypothetical protein DN402_00795 [Streptomyces sp. SW4]